MEELTTTGYLKAGFMGFAGSGKTHTSIMLGLGLLDHLKSKSDVAMFDTETGSAYVQPLVKQHGRKLLGKRSRSLDELVAMGHQCVDEGIELLVVDSMTHVWRDCVDSYLWQINEARKHRNMSARTSLEFQDWGPIKSKFGEWTDLFLNAPLHIIIAGRAGYEYDYDRNAETNKKELVKTGIKMKTEGEFGFEPSLLVMMEQEYVKDRAGNVTNEIVHQATVLKDRWRAIHGQTFSFNPNAKDNKNHVFEAFRPHIEMLQAGAHAPIEQGQSHYNVDLAGDAQYHHEKKRKEILCEEIQHELLVKFPGQSAHEKKAKGLFIQACFHTGSWTKVESMKIPELEKGLSALRDCLNDEATFNKILEGAA